MIAATARMGQFVASWPNFSPHAYSLGHGGRSESASFSSQLDVAVASHPSHCHTTHDAVMILSHD